MPSVRSRPAIGLLIDALYNEYGSALVTAFEAASARRDVDLLCFAGGTLNSHGGSELQRNRCYDLVSKTSLDAVVLLAMNDSPADHAALLSGFAGMPACSVGLEVPGCPLVCVDNLS